jgi:glycosyltransferase involved in cell wall biosynthesis
MRIGILKISNPEKGLGKCADTLAWALRKHEIALFPVWQVASLYRRPGDRFLAWARSCDVVFLIEQFLPAAVEHLQRNGVRVVFVPNLDWAVLMGDADVSTWVEAVRSSGVDVWARTPCIRRALSAAGVNAFLTRWSIPDSVCMERAATSGRHVTFYMNAGRGGWRQRRGVDLALEAFAILRRRRVPVRLVLKTLRTIDELRGHAPIDACVSIVQGWRSPAAMSALLARADVVLHPSRWEGLGLPMLEALHAGVPVIATDGWPMNEFVEDERNGLLVPARRAGRMRLAPHWECDPRDIAAAMERLVVDPQLRARLTCASPGVWLRRQRMFALAVARALEDRSNSARAVRRQRRETPARADRVQSRPHRRS